MDTLVAIVYNLLKFGYFFEFKSPIVTNHFKNLENSNTLSQNTLERPDGENKNMVSTELVIQLVFSAQEANRLSNTISSQPLVLRVPGKILADSRC